MRVLLSWADEGPELISLMRELKKHSHQIIYTIAHPDLDIGEFPETILHSYADAIYNIPPKEIDSDRFLPVGRDIIDRLHRTELLVLPMMDRMLDKKCVDERKHIYYDMLRYWLGVFKEYKPEFVIFPNMPHFVYDFIIYELAHFLNVPTLAFDDTRIGGRLLFFKDLWKGSELLQKKLQENKGKMFSLDDLSEDVQKYCRPRMAIEYDRAPQYIVDQKKKYTVWKWLRSEPKVRTSLKNFSFIYKAPRYAYKLLRHRPDITKRTLKRLFYKRMHNLQKEYRKAQVLPALNKDFVYFALHNQPERSTSPQGGIFVDQILAIEILAASLPEGWVLYVKEHPMQWLRTGLNFSNSRYRGYYEKIARIKNVFMVPVEVNSYDLIKKARIIATITGAAAWEAALQLKPSIIFGAVWYQDCPGIFKVDGVDSCQRAIQKIKEGFMVDKNELINYLRCFDGASIKGFISAFSGKESGMTKAEGMKNITAQILEELKN